MDEDTELTHAKARRDRSADPLGKRALFSVPSDSDPGVGAQGRRAVFSGGDRAPEVGIDLNAGVGPRSGRRFTVRCQRCRQVSRVSLVDLLIFQFPIGVWIPRGTFDRRMTCPSCRKRSWCSVTLRRD